MMVKYAATGSKAGKGRLQQEVVQAMKDMGGRFLKHDSSGSAYEEMDDAEARSKVGQALRYRMKNRPLGGDKPLVQRKKRAVVETPRIETPYLASGQGLLASSTGGLLPRAQNLAQLQHLLAHRSVPPRNPTRTNELLLNLIQNRPPIGQNLAVYPHNSLGYSLPGLGGIGTSPRIGTIYSPQGAGHLVSHLRPHDFSALLKHHSHIPGASHAPNTFVHSETQPENKRRRLDSNGIGARQGAGSDESIKTPSRREEEDVALLLTSMARSS